VAGLIGFGNCDCISRSGPPDDLYAIAVVLRGHGTLVTARERLDFGPGSVFLDPPDLPCTAAMRKTSFRLVQVPRSAAGALAEEFAGLAAADLRFDAMAPVSANRAAMWSETARYLCRELVGSGITEISTLLAAAMTRQAAAALLETFPNTTMTLRT
jgi:hypothetical protein